MDVLLSIAGINQPPPPETTESMRWAGVLSIAMEPDSQIDFITDMTDKTHPLTPLGAFVLANQMCTENLGLDMYAASNLSADVLGAWFPFSAWCTGHGLNPTTMEPSLLLAAAYKQQLETVSGGEQKDFDRLHMRIFGTKHPWGR